MTKYLLLVACLVAACDHADSSGPPDAAPITEAPDARAPMTPLMITSRSPAQGSGGVAQGAAISITFNGALDPTSSGGFSLTSGSGPVPGTTAVLGATLTFTPSSTLALGTTYTVNLDGTVKDLAGDAFAGASWFFTTVADTTPPTLVSSSPADGAINVHLDSPITATFSEPIDPASLNIAMSAGQIDVKYTTNVSGKVLTIMPSPSWAYSTQYSVYLLGGITDLAGNHLQPTAWMFNTLTAPDTTAPTVAFTITPAARSSAKIGAFTWTNTDADSPSGITASCALDGAAPVDCTSSASYTTPSLVDGMHTLTVIATDSSANHSLPATYAWTVDTGAPALAGVTCPASPTNINKPTYSFSATDGGGSGDVIAYTCGTALDPTTACTSSTSQTFSTALPDGAYTFYVKACDNAQPAANCAQSSCSVTIDTSKPSVAFGSGPASRSSLKTPTLTWAFNDAGGTGGITATCSLDGKAAAACTTSNTFTPPSLADGSHGLAVIATDLAGNHSDPVSFSWIVDTTPPAVAGPICPASPTRNSMPTYTFSASDNGGGADVISYSCGTAANPTAACTSATSQTFSTPLLDGTYSFYVKACDNASPQANCSQPASCGPITIDTTAPTVTFTSTPNAYSNLKNPTFTWNSSDPGDSSALTLACTLDGNSVPCTSSTAYTTSQLADGSHTFSVAATDPAGNLSAPASFAWKVGTVPPSVVSSTIYPPDQAIGVSVGTQIRASFNEAIDPASITVATVKVTYQAVCLPEKTGSTPSSNPTLCTFNLAGGRVLSSTGKQITFIPNGSLSFSTKYNVTLSTGIMDLYGNHLATNVPWSFTSDSAPPPPPPAQVSNLVATPKTSSVTLGWPAVSGADEYLVRQGLSSGGEQDLVTVESTGAANYTFTDTKLNNGTTYFYTVIASNAGGPATGSPDEMPATPQWARSWTQRPVTTGRLVSVALEGNKVYAVADSIYGTTGLLLSNDGGVSWSLDGGDTNPGYAIAVDANGLWQYTSNNGFVDALCAQPGCTWYSPPIVASQPNVLYGITSDSLPGRPDRFVAVGENGQINNYDYSLGNPLTTPQTPASYNLNSVATDHAGHFVAVGGGGVIIYSEDDSNTWSTRAPFLDNGTPITFTLNGVTYDASQNVWVAVGARGLIIHTNNPTGGVWTLASGGGSADLYGISYSNGVLVAVGLSGTILWSTNGTDFLAGISGTMADLYSVTAGPSTAGEYVVVGADRSTSAGVILTSP